MPELTEFVLYFFDGDRLPPRRKCLEALIAAASSWVAEPSEVYRLDWASGRELTGTWVDDHLVSTPLSETEILNVYCASTIDPGTVCALQVVEARGRAVYSIGVPAAQVEAVPEPDVERGILEFYRVARRWSRVIVCVGSEIDVEPHYADAASLLSFAGSFLRCDWIMMDEPELLPVTGYESRPETDGLILLRRLGSPAASALKASSTSDEHES